MVFPCNKPLQNFQTRPTPIEKFGIIFIQKSRNNNIISNINLLILYNYELPEKVLCT